MAAGAASYETATGPSHTVTKTGAITRKTQSILFNLPRQVPPTLTKNPERIPGAMTREVSRRELVTWRPELIDCGGRIMALKWWTLPVSLFFLLGASGCGVKGPLYLPKSSQQNQPSGQTQPPAPDPAGNTPD